MPTPGNPTRESWERIIEIYGESKAKGILGSIRTIMIGNTYGIPGVLFQQTKGKGDPEVVYFMSLK